MAQLYDYYVFRNFLLSNNTSSAWPDNRHDNSNSCPSGLCLCRVSSRAEPSDLSKIEPNTFGIVLTLKIAAVHRSCCRLHCLFNVYFMLAVLLN